MESQAYNWKKYQKGGVSIYERMLRESKEIDRKIKEIRKLLKEFPKGKLLLSFEGPYVKWYKSDGHKKIYIKKKDKVVAEKLATKKYLSALLEDLEKEKSATDMYLRHCVKGEGKADALFESSSEFQMLLSPHFFPLSKKLDDWMKSSYKNNLNYPEHLTQKVGPNEFVRSKSEAIIAKNLKQHKIPYRYEAQLLLGEIEMYPDFTIRHPSTGEVYYWEHFGLLDNSNYVKNMHNKMNLYTANGIMPGINLITTYETKEKPLNFEMVEMLVSYYFL